MPVGNANVSIAVPAQHPRPWTHSCVPVTKDWSPEVKAFSQLLPDPLGDSVKVQSFFPLTCLHS